MCGRTLLRGEHAEVYVSGGSRRTVCELCTSRALHSGWVREGTVPEYDGSNDRPDRRRSLLSRLRNRRDVASAVDLEAGQEPAIEQAPERTGASEWQTRRPAPSAGRPYRGGASAAPLASASGRRGRTGQEPGVPIRP